MRILSFWVRPDFDYTIRAGGDHLSSLDRMVLGPGDHFIMNPRRRIWLQDGRLISSPASPRKKKRQLENGPGTGLRSKRNLNAHVKEIPCPDCAILISADDASFIKTKACPASIGGVDVAFEVI